jgi:hypothetical protein
VQVSTHTGVSQCNKIFHYESYQQKTIRAVKAGDFKSSFHQKNWLVALLGWCFSIFYFLNVFSKIKAPVLKFFLSVLYS